MATKKAKKKAAKKTKTPARAAAKKRAAPSRKAPAKKAIAKKAKGRTPKAAAKKKAAPKAVARAKPIRRRDHAGHIDPKYGADLLGLSSREDAASSFVERPRSGDDLVEELGEEVVHQATSAEYDAEDALNQEVAEDVGGPFVETAAGTEFAGGTDPSNPKGATREPFPRT